MLDDANILVPLSWPAQHSSTTISGVHTKPRLITEHHRGVVSSSPVHMNLSPGKSSRRCSSVSGTQMQGLLLRRLASCSLFLIVWMQTLVPVTFKRSERRDRAELNRFRKACRAIKRSSLRVVARCLSPACRLTAVPNTWYLIHALETTLCDAPSMFSTRVCVHPPSSIQTQRDKFITRQMASLTLLLHYQQRVSTN